MPPQLFRSWEHKNHWTTKCRSDLHVFWGQSLPHSNWLSQVCHSLIKFSLTDLCKAKSLNHEIQVTDQHIFMRSILEVLCVTLIHYPRIRIHPSKSPQYKILTKITGPWSIGHWRTCMFIRSTFVSHWSIIPSYMTFIHQKFSRYKLIGPWNIGHRPI